MSTIPLDTAPALALTPGGEVIEVGDDTVTLAVVIDAGRLVVVLRALAEPDVTVRVPVNDADAVHLARAVAGSLRYLHHTDGCPACNPHWNQP